MKKIEELTREEAQLRLDRAMSFVERWRRYLEREPNDSLEHCLNEMEMAILDTDGEKLKGA